MLMPSINGSRKQGIYQIIKNNFFTFRCLIKCNFLSYRTSMMEGSGSLEQQLEATKVRLIEKDIIKILFLNNVYV